MVSESYHNWELYDNKFFCFILYCYYSLCDNPHKINGMKALLFLG